jgi:dihydropteroate synthase
VRWCYGRAEFAWEADPTGVLAHRTRIMGIVNVTPDSFSDGGQFLAPDLAVRHGLRLIADGADLLDVGGESTRPGSDAVSLKDELARVIPVIQGLRGQTDAPLSIDTTKAEVARQALAAGADIINDISAFTGDDRMADVAKESRCGIVLMHMRGRPKTMQTGDLSAVDVVGDVTDYLTSRVNALVDAGIARSRICVDPGIGFGKTLGQNLQLHGAIGALSAMGTAVLMGASRKSFIGQITERETEGRVFGTAASVAISAWLRAHVVRVHDVAQMRDVVRVANALRRAASC